MASKHNNQAHHVEAPPREPTPLPKIISVASIAGGVQFGWALLLSLLTPYIQLLGIPHNRASLIWLCGPISGILFQPIVGYHSDRCTSRFGRRRPFISAGVLAFVIAALLIGYSADLGHSFGDALDKKTRPRAIVFFVVGFWIFDVATNMFQGPLRALVADLADGDQRKTRTANAFFSFFMAIGNILGYAAGSYGGLYHVFPYTKTEACNVSCANLKSCFIISIILLVLPATVAMIYVKEKRVSSEEKRGMEGGGGGGGGMRCFGELFGSFLELKKPMWILLLVTCLNWLAWFPFFQFNTDYVGREVYGGSVGENIFDMGVRLGTVGLMLNAVMLGVTSLTMEVLVSAFGGVNRLWGIVNLLLAICLGMTFVLAKFADHSRRYSLDNHQPLPPPAGIKAATLLLFTLMGIPLSITFSIPFALASTFSTTAGAGLGLSLGALNLAIAAPQLLVSLTIGQWDSLFGGGNLPAFMLAAVAAATSGVLSIILLPSPPPDLAKAAPAAGEDFH